MATQTLAPLPARLGAATRPQRTACTPTRRHSCVLPRQRPCVVQASGGSGCCGGSGSSSASQGEAGQPAKEVRFLGFNHLDQHGIIWLGSAEMRCSLCGT